MSTQQVDEAIKGQSDDEDDEDEEDGGDGKVLASRPQSSRTKKLSDGVAPAASLYVNSALTDVKDDDFKDIEGGHKRYNRLWLQSKNPMASACRFIHEGDESRFSMGLIEECWYLLVNQVSWKRLLLINGLVEMTVIVLFATILAAIAGESRACESDELKKTCVWHLEI